MEARNKLKVKIIHKNNLKRGNRKEVKVNHQEFPSKRNNTTKKIASSSIRIKDNTAQDKRVNIKNNIQINHITKIIRKKIKKLANNNLKVLNKSHKNNTNHLDLEVNFFFFIIIIIKYIYLLIYFSIIYKYIYL